MRAAVTARGPAVRLRLAALVFCALAHLADVMLGIKFEAELGHEIELGLGGLLIKRAPTFPPLDRSLYWTANVFRGRRSALLRPAHPVVGDQTIGQRDQRGARRRILDGQERLDQPHGFPPAAASAGRVARKITRRLAVFARFCGHLQDVVAGLTRGLVHGLTFRRTKFR